MQNESLAGKMMQLEDSSRDMEAESELEKLEQRLGLKPAATTVDVHQTVSVTEAGVPATGTPATPGATQGEAEKALEDLEKRLNSGN